jgi:hypothetical protein
MGDDNVVEFQGREASSDPLTELLKAGAQQLIRQAVYPLGEISRCVI